MVRPLTLVMLLVASETRTVITTHHVLGIFNVSSTQKWNKILVPSSFLGVKNLIARLRLKMSNMSLAVTIRIQFMTPMVQKGILKVVGPSVPLASTGLARRLFSNCDQIVLKKQQEFNGFAMGLCLSIRPFLSLRR